LPSNLQGFGRWATLFTSYEGALRVPFAARWPGRIEAGRVSDQIVHAMDLYANFGFDRG